MTKRKHDAYTLWMKWRNVGWRAEITVSQTSQWSPIEIIKDWLEAKQWVGNPYSVWQQGKTWMIKPAGEMPADAKQERDV